jgi:outer membrane protein assembly factor BamB
MLKVFSEALCGFISQMKSFSTIVCILTAIGWSGISQADDWPAWRGPRGDGSSAELNAPLHWSSTDNIAWKTPLPGVGRSSPIVSGDRVFVTSGDATDNTRHVMSFDRLTGMMQWNITVHQGPGGQMHRFNTTASSTPATDGQLVFAAFVDDKDLRIYATPAISHGQIFVRTESQLICIGEKSM